MSNLLLLLTLLIMFCFLLSLNSILEDAVDESPDSVVLQETRLSAKHMLKPPLVVGNFVVYKNSVLVD